MNIEFGIKDFCGTRSVPLSLHFLLLLHLVDIADRLKTKVHVCVCVYVYVSVKEGCTKEIPDFDHQLSESGSLFGVVGPAAGHE